MTNTTALWALVAVAFLACSGTGAEQSTQAPNVARQCSETISAYCARNRCLLDGVRSTGNFTPWCMRVGPFSSSHAGASTCGKFVVFDATRDDFTLEHWYDSATGKLVFVKEFRAATGTSNCAGSPGVEEGCVKVGVGMGCTEDAGIADGG